MIREDSDGDFWVSYESVSVPIGLKRLRSLYYEMLLYDGRRPGGYMDIPLCPGFATQFRANYEDMFEPEDLMYTLNIVTDDLAFGPLNIAEYDSTYMYLRVLSSLAAGIDYRCQSFSTIPADHYQYMAHLFDYSLLSCAIPPKLLHKL